SLSFFFSSRRRHTRSKRDWSSDVCSSDLGCALARELLSRSPGAEVTLLEKEIEVGAHQSGHNSGVVHAGLYYTPGSLKARLCRRGGGLLREYAQARGVAYDEGGKGLIAREGVGHESLGAPARGATTKAARCSSPGMR